MGTKRPGRSWPYPRRALSPDGFDPACWDELARLCELSPTSSDAVELRQQLAELTRSITVTLDGRLVSEARPSPKEIRDPLVTEGIPAALALSRYLGNLDVLAIDGLLRGGYESAFQQRGMRPDDPLEFRAFALSSLAMTLRTLVPAMIHVARANAERVTAGRPAASRRETGYLLIELATIWARLSEAEWSRFPAFARCFLVAAGIAPPSRELCAAALREAGDLDSLDEEGLQARRAAAWSERLALLHTMDAWASLRLSVSSYAEQAGRAARDLGWNVEGEDSTSEDATSVSAKPTSRRRAKRSVR